MLPPLPSSKESFNWLRQLWRLASDNQKNATEIKELRQELDDLQEGFEELSDLVKDLIYAQQRDRENAQHEREKLELRLELALARAGMSLPPSSQRTRELPSSGVTEEGHP